MVPIHLDHREALARCRKPKEKEESNEKRKEDAKGIKGKGKDKIGGLTEDKWFVDEAAFSAWLHGSCEPPLMGMQSLIERKGTNSDHAPEVIGMLADVATRRKRRRPRYQKCECLHENCSASATNLKRVGSRFPFQGETRPTLCLPPLETHASASRVAAS